MFCLDVRRETRLSERGRDLYVAHVISPTLVRRESGSDAADSPPAAAPTRLPLRQSSSSSLRITSPRPGMTRVPSGRGVGSPSTPSPSLAALSRLCTLLRAPLPSPDATVAPSVLIPALQEALEEAVRNSSNVSSPVSPHSPRLKGSSQRALSSSRLAGAEVVAGIPSTAECDRYLDVAKRSNRNDTRLLTWSSMEVLDTERVVIDTGTYSTKVGFSNMHEGIVIPSGVHSSGFRRKGGVDLEGGGKPSFRTY